MVRRLRKSSFIRLFDKTPPSVVCPHFYELILSNGCPFNCLYCYLKLTFRGDKSPVLFTNPWQEVEKDLEKLSHGIFSTGELADSLAIVPPLLLPAIEYFRKQKDKFLLLTTKSDNIEILLGMEPTDQVIVSFSINAIEAYEKFENKTPHPFNRLFAAKKLKEAGWRVRIRLDPVIAEIGLKTYKNIIERVKELSPELVTIGTLRQFPGLFRFEKHAPRKGLAKSADGRMRYPLSMRLAIYDIIGRWLGFQPSLCKETREVWEKLGWNFAGCNCSVIKLPELDGQKLSPLSQELNPHSAFPLTNLA